MNILLVLLLLFHPRLISSSPSNNDVILSAIASALNHQDFNSISAQAMSDDGYTPQVTLVGQSAGAQSVMFHLMSSKSAPLFHRAVLSSLPAIFQYPSFEEALESTKFVLNVTGCEKGNIEEGVECLRNLTAEDLVPLRVRLMLKNIKDANLVGLAEPFGMVLDGEEFKENPIQFVQNGHWQDGDSRFVILGSTIEETNQIRAFIPNVIKFDKVFFENLLIFVFGEEMGTQLSEKYDSMYNGPRKDYVEILGELITDGFFVCPIRALARLTSEYTNTYLYSFAHRMNDSSCEDSWTPGSVCDYVYHSSDNVFLFRTAPVVPYNFSENDEQAANQISYYWGNFATSGNPSSGDVTVETFPEWPQYLPNSAIMQILRPMLEDYSRVREATMWPNLVIESPLKEFDHNYKEEICDFWDATKYYVDPDRSGSSTTTTEPAEDTTNIVTGTSSGTPSDTSDVTHFVTTEGRLEETTSGVVVYRLSNALNTLLVVFIFLFIFGQH